MKKEWDSMTDQEKNDYLENAVNFILSKDQPTPVTEFVKNIPRQREVWRNNIRECMQAEAESFKLNDTTCRYLTEVLLSYLLINGWEIWKRDTTLLDSRGWIAWYPRWEKEGKGMAD